MNKKGSLLDLVLIAVTLLIVAITTIFAYKIYDEFNTNFQANDDIDAKGKAASSQILAHFPGIIDNSFLFMALMLSLGAFVFAGLVRIHPIFFVFFIMGWAIVIFLAGIFSNVYTEISANAEFTALADNLKFTSLIMSYLPFIVGIFGFMLSIVMYKLWRVSEV
jgi:hypothetical protein